MGDVFPFRFLWGPTVIREWQGSSAGAMDWIEKPSSHLLKFNVPGHDKEGIKIQLEEDNILSIRGGGFSKKEESTMKDSILHVNERGKGEFERRIILPDNVKADQIKAHVENGVLTILLPKEPAMMKPKARSIPVLSKL